MTIMTQSVTGPTKAAAIKAIQTRRHQVPALKDDDVWRDFLATATDGIRSLREMDGPALDKVSAALTKAGARLGPGRSAAKLPSDPQSRKLRAVWITMGQAGVVRDRREAALCAWCARQLGLPQLDSLSFLNPQQRGRCIDDLVQWARSKGVAV